MLLKVNYYCNKQSFYKVALFIHFVDNDTYQFIVSSVNSDELKEAARKLDWTLTQDDSIKDTDSANAEEIVGGYLKRLGRTISARPDPILTAFLKEQAFRSVPTAFPNYPLDKLRQQWGLVAEDAVKTARGKVVPDSTAMEVESESA